MGTVESDIERIVTAYNRANDGTDYAETIVCETRIIDGDNFRMLWSTRYDGEFVPDN